MMALATVTAVSPKVTVRKDADTADVTVIVTAGQHPVVADRVLVWILGAGKRPFLVSPGSGS